MDGWPADIVKSAGTGPSTGSPSHTPELEACLTRLVQAMEAQTAAIGRLAQSNEMLVQAMAHDGDIGEAEPVGYLNGKR